MLVRWVLIGLACTLTSVTDPIQALAQDARAGSRRGADGKATPVAQSAKNNDFVGQEETAKNRNKMRILRALVGAEGSGGPLLIRGRMGGLGGTGGSRSSDRILELLLMSPPLQRELKVTDKQKNRLDALSKSMKMDIQKAFQGHSVETTQDMTSEEQQAYFAALRERRSAITERVQNELAQILNTNQVGRLQQIVLQIKGPFAVAESPVAEAVGLDELQLAQVKEIIAEMNAKQRQVVQAKFGSGVRADAPRQGEGEQRPGDKPNPESKKETDLSPSRTSALNSEPRPGGTSTSERAAGAAHSKSTNTPVGPNDGADRMASLIDESERLRGEAIGKIGKILFASQKQAFNKLLGKRVDDLASLLPDEGSQQARNPKP